MAHDGNSQECLLKQCKNHYEKETIDISRMESNWLLQRTQVALWCSESISLKGKSTLVTEINLVLGFILNLKLHRKISYVFKQIKDFFVTWYWINMMRNQQCCVVKKLTGKKNENHWNFSGMHSGTIKI